MNSTQTLLPLLLTCVFLSRLPLIVVEEVEEEEEEGVEMGNSDAERMEGVEG